ncbi:MAG: glycoside hydrolase family 127 protein [Actinomycetes bacterium]
MAPLRQDTTVLRPVGFGDVTLRGGFWGERQQRNRDATIPHGLDWLERAGNLDNLRDVARGEPARPYRGMLFADSDVHKTLEGVAWELGRAADPRLRDWLRATTRLLADAQDEDGYLDSHVQSRAFEQGRETRWTDLPFGHELYCLGHLVQAAVADVRATGETALLDVARRFADLAYETFGPDGREGVGGHPEVETALVELYRVTEEPRYLELARLLVDRRGHGVLGPSRFGSTYYQDDVSVRDDTTFRGHAVRALYLAAGVVDVYTETGDRTLLDAVVRQWEHAVATKTYVTGGQGSRHRDESFGDPYELPPDRAYAETCAGIASVMLSWRLLLVTGESRYADLIERTLFNLVAASTSLDGRHFFYVNPLRHRDVSSRGDTADVDGVVSHGHDMVGRAAWFDCACCPPNLMRLLSSLHTYVATADEQGLQVHQYAAGDVATTLPDGREVGVRVATEYPWSGRVAVTVTHTGDEPWSLALRVPGWATSPTLTVAGEAVPVVPDARGYVVVHRAWSVGDEAVLDLDLTPRVVEPHPRVDAVRGCVAFEYGPLVYCLEQVDQPEHVRLDDVVVSADATPKVVPREDLLGGCVTLELDGAVRDVAGWGDQTYRARHSGVGGAPARDVSLVAVPYALWAGRGLRAMRVWVPATGVSGR